MITRQSIALAIAVACIMNPAVCHATNSPLADAAERKDWTAVRTMAADRIDANTAQPDGMTALHWAVLHDDERSVATLLAASADANAKNRYGVTPLSLACASGNAAIIANLIEAGADVHAELAGGGSPLMTAARTGRVEAVTALLAAGANVDHRERHGQTPLMWAAAEGHVEVVDALLTAGADFQTPLPSGFSPLFFAVRAGRTAVALRLIKAGESVNQTMRPQSKDAATKRTTPLLLAIENGHFELAAALLEAGADPNATPAGYSALHALTWVRKPIRGDGDPSPRGSGRLTSLELARQLVDHSADVNARYKANRAEPGRFTIAGATPFLLAARASDMPLMKTLLQLGADPQLATAVNCTPLLAAAGVGALENGEETAGSEEEAVAALRLLLDLGANVNAVDDHGETAMHGAAYQSWPKVVALLAQHGADASVWNRENKCDWTPLEIAQGSRPGNIRPSPETEQAIMDVTPSRDSDKGF